VPLLDAAGAASDIPSMSKIGRGGATTTTIPHGGVPGGCAR
jgi:hypothetical protein